MTKSLIVLGLCAAATLFAQGPPPGRGPGRMGPGGPGGPGGMMGRGMGPGMNRTVTGAPYSAVEVHESSQTLANGNVITRKNQSNVYRDSSGRVRTETTFSARRAPGQTAGAAATETPRTIVNIHDPVAGVSRELDAQTKTCLLYTSWQQEYLYAAPMRLPAGTDVVMEFTYDNSTDNPRNPNHPPRRVTWGPSSNDEMAGLHIAVVPVRPADAEDLGAALWGKMIRATQGGGLRKQ